MLKNFKDPLSSSICYKNVSRFGVKNQTVSIFGHLMGEASVFWAIFALIHQYGGIICWDDLQKVLVKQFHFSLRKGANG